MAVNRNVSSVILVVLVSLFIHTKANYTIGRSGFPKGFIFGAGSSAYQVEGGAKAEGKGPSIWDFYTHKDPGSVWDKSDGDVGADFFQRYKEDIQLMKEMGLDYFRFSISWPRILPKGNKAGGINRKGIEFYNNLINELLAHGIKPFVTLYHWDVPQALEEKYGGFLSPKIMADFTNYADVCFQEFGDRVKHWVTLDEPNINAELGYATGFLAPNRCTRTNTSYPCVAGNSATEPYIVGHHLLLSHAYAVTLYRNKYQEFQKGQIGITVGCSWVVPFDMSRTTLFATIRAFEQSCGWFFSPVKFGDYPESMRKLIKERLPKFTPEESNLLKNSSDFLGANYYTGSYVKDYNATTQHYNEDANAIKTFWDKNGIPIGKPTPVPWIFDYPEGLRNLTLYMKRQYNNPVIYVMENGYATKDEPNKTYSRDYYLKDQHRIDYLNGHLSYLQRAIMAGANVKGYLASSFLDSFEWSAGYILKSGFNYVDHEDRLKRHKKDSAKWYQQFLRS